MHVWPVHLDLVEGRVFTVFELGPEMACAIRVLVDAHLERAVCGHPLRFIALLFFLLVLPSANYPEVAVPEVVAFRSFLLSKRQTTASNQTKTSKQLCLARSVSWLSRWQHRVQQ